MFEKKLAKTNYIVVTVVTAFLLFVLGLWSFHTLLLQFAESITETSLIGLNPGASFKLASADALLLAACAPAAAVMLWAYSRKRAGWPRIYGFFLYLLVAIASVAAGISLRLFVIANRLRLLSQFGSATVAIDFLRYSQWGFGALIIVCGAITVLLLVLSQRRKEKLTEEA